tara:strand:+ start:1272 stop:1634 length:363 start_codon:yes stop_codon:yes gene_type:complete
MIKIELSNASNGVIKKVIHSTFASDDLIEEEITVFECDESKEKSKESIEKISQILYSISDDLGLETGSKFDKHQLTMNIDWGHKYEPTVKEIDERIKSLREEIKHLKEEKNQTVINANNV